MPERLEKLRSALTELERELHSLDTVDAETRAVLEEASREIEVALHKQDSASLRSPSLFARLETAGRDFEATHPMLGSLVTRVLDALGQMGI